jgi:uncharacterized protein YqgV (UPF0045/DUF77 family)
MSKFNVFMSLLGDLEKPIEALAKWLEEPLRRAQHERDVHLQTVAVDLEVKRRTEVLKIVTEIEELKKDAEVQRFQKSLKVISEYQDSLRNMQTDFLRAIGGMSIELTAKAHEMVVAKQVVYHRLMNEIKEDYSNDMEKIYTRFENNEKAQDRLLASLDEHQAIKIGALKHALEQLMTDLSSMTLNISDLGNKNNELIGRHIELLTNKIPSNNVLPGGDTIDVEFHDVNSEANP